MKATISMLLMSLLCVFATAQTKTVTVTVSNDWETSKESEPIVVNLSDVKGLNFVVKGASVRLDGKEIPCQLDDMDGDLVADELFFLTDIKGKEVQRFEVELRAASDVATTEEGSARLYCAFQLRDKADKHPDVLKVEASGKSDIFNDIYMHGITVESELVGYRIYFDHRQNIDLYGKKYRRVELPETQFYTTAEQLAQGYGVDVLWAGSAIGCGSFKDYHTDAPQNWTDVKVRGQRVVTNGNLRTVVEVYDLGVQAEDGTTFDMHQYYTLCAGHRDLKVDVVFDKALSKTFCTGVQKVGVTAADSVRRGHISEGILREDGIAASWGCDYPDMGKKQLWKPEPVGLAVYVPTEYVSGRQEDELNYLYKVRSGKGNALRYYVSFCADKEEQGYHSAKEWFASLEGWKASVSHPVSVKVGK